nr:T9SS type A sorting domain-containing protein [Bacteroidota bacterium]
IKFRFEGDSDAAYSWNIDDVWVVEQNPVTSVSDVEPENQIFVYPNPAKDVLSISNNRNSSISVYNLSGQLMMKEVAVYATFRLDISNFESGIYIVKVLDEKATFTSKVNVMN